MIGELTKNCKSGFLNLNVLDLYSSNWSIPRASLNAMFRPNSQGLRSPNSFSKPHFLATNLPFRLICRMTTSRPDTRYLINRAETKRCFRKFPVHTIFIDTMCFRWLGTSLWIQSDETPNRRNAWEKFPPLCIDRFPRARVIRKRRIFREQNVPRTHILSYLKSLDLHRSRQAVLKNFVSVAKFVFDDLLARQSWVFPLS